MAVAAKLNRTTSRALAAMGVRTRDDAHMTWVAAEVESEHAMRAWSEGDAPNRAAAYLAYNAALDREEAAANDLQRLCEPTQPYQDWLGRSKTGGLR